MVNSPLAATGSLLPMGVTGVVTLENDVCMRGSDPLIAIDPMALPLSSRTKPPSALVFGDGNSDCNVPGNFDLSGVNSCVNSDGSRVSPEPEPPPDGALPP